MGKNTRQIFTLCVTLFVATLVGCGKSKFDRQEPPPPYYQQPGQPVRVWQDNGNPNQPITGVNPGCNQPTREFTEISEFCRYISDETIHRGCNTESQRQLIYREKCLIGSQPPAPPSNPSVPSNPSTPTTTTPQTPTVSTGPVPVPRPTTTVSSSTHTTVVTNTQVSRSGTLTVEQRTAIIREIGLCDPTTVVVTKPGRPTRPPVAIQNQCISKDRVEDILKSRKNRSVLKCDTTDAKQIGADEYGNPLWKIAVMTGSEITETDIVASCKCIVELNCKAKRKTNGKTDLSWDSVEGCDKKERLEAIYQCAIHNCPETVQETAKPVPCKTESTTIGTVTESEVTCGETPAPVAPVAPIQPPAPVVPVEENACYPMKSRRIDLMNLPDEKYVQLSDKFNLQAKLEEMSRKHSGARMVVARVNTQIFPGSNNGLVSAEFKQAVVDQIFGSIPSCQDYSVNERPCPIKSVQQSNSNVVMELNKSKAKIYDLVESKTAPELLISYINVAGLTTVEFVSANEIKVMTEFVVHYDKTSGRFVQNEGENIETNKVRITDRIVWTKNPKSVKIQAEPSLVGLLKETRNEALAPNCGAETAVNK